MNSKDYKTYRNVLEIKTLPIKEAINIKTLEDVKNNPLFKDFDLREEDLEHVFAPKDYINNYDFYRAHLHMRHQLTLQILREQCIPVIKIVRGC